MRTLGPPPVGHGTYGRLGHGGTLGTASRGAWDVREAGTRGDPGDRLPWGVGRTGGWDPGGPWGPPPVGRGTYGRLGPGGTLGTASRGAWDVREAGTRGDPGDRLPWGVGRMAGWDPGGPWGPPPVGRGMYGRLGPGGTLGTASRGAWDVREAGTRGDPGDRLPWGVGRMAGWDPGGPWGPPPVGRGT